MSPGSLRARCRATARAPTRPHGAHEAPSRCLGCSRSSYPFLSVAGFTAFRLRFGHPDALSSRGSGTGSMRHGKTLETGARWSVSSVQLKTEVAHVHRCGPRACHPESESTSQIELLKKTRLFFFVFSFPITKCEAYGYGYTRYTTKVGLSPQRGAANVSLKHLLNIVLHTGSFTQQECPDSHQDTISRPVQTPTQYLLRSPGYKVSAAIT